MQLVARGVSASRMTLIGYGEIPTPRDYVFREGDVLPLVGADARLAAFTT